VAHGESKRRKKGRRKPAKFVIGFFFQCHHNEANGILVTRIVLPCWIALSCGVVEDLFREKRKIGPLCDGNNSHVEYVE